MIRAWIEYYLWRVWGWFADRNDFIWHMGAAFDIRISYQFEIFEYRDDYGWPIEEVIDWR